MTVTLLLSIAKKRTYLSVVLFRDFGREKQVIYEAQNHEDIETEVGQCCCDKRYSLERFLRPRLHRLRFSLFLWKLSTVSNIVLFTKACCPYHLSHVGNERTILHILAATISRYIITLFITCRAINGNN